MLKCESIETTKITYNIPVTTGYEDDCKIIHPETGNIYRDAAEVKSCFRREQNLSFELFYNHGKVWNLEYLDVHVHLRMLLNWMYGNVFSFKFCTHLVTNFALLFLPSRLVRDWRNKALALLSTYNVHTWCALSRCHLYQYLFYRLLLCKGLCSVWTIWRFTCFSIIFPMVVLPTEMLTYMYQMVSIMFRTFLGVANIDEVTFTQVKLNAPSGQDFSLKVNLTKKMH